jgi:hypothetical protein
MSVWKQKRRQWEERSTLPDSNVSMSMPAPLSIRRAKPMMGLGAGGRMRQVIYPDIFDITDWDVAAAERAFVTLANAENWKSITGEAALNHPPTAQDYARAGLPWFQYYGADQTALPGSEKLSGVKSVGSMFKKKTGAPIPHSQDVKTSTPKPIGPGKPSSRPISNPIDWE